MSSEQIDIFISYARLDDEPMPGVERGWVTELVRGLRIQVSRNLGRAENFTLFMDNQLSGNKAITPQVMNMLNSSYCLVLVLSTAYLASPWCRKELAAFLKRTGIDSHRIFVIEPEEIEAPEEIRDLKGYRFYEKTPENKLIRFGYPRPNPEQLTYYQLIDDLGRDLAKILIGKDPEQPTSHFTHTVLLAPVSDDLQEQRRVTCRFFEQENVRVLPPTNYYPIREWESAFAADLDDCDLFVQLISDNPGAGLPAAYYQQARTTASPMLLWQEEGLDHSVIQDSDHKLLFDSKDLVIGELVDFQREVMRRFASPDKPPLTPSELFLFVNYAPEDGEHLDPLLVELDRRGISHVEPLSPAEAGTPAEARRDLTNNLLFCDALLMLCYNSPPTWAREQLMLWRKTAPKRELPLKGIGVCKEPRKNLAITLPNLRFIDCPDRCPKQCLDALSFISGEGE